jgi:hypothetical protein
MQGLTRASESNPRRSTMATQQKLERIHNRITQYELVCTDQNGIKCLAGYTRQSKMGILSMLRKNGEKWAQRLSEKDVITFAKSGKVATLGKYTVYFSQRTQREAIIAGELPWFEDAIK